MFCNKYNHTIDDKGRLIIPVEYREELAGVSADNGYPRRFYITTNLWDPMGAQEPCLYLWPEDNYRMLRDKLAGMSEQDPQVRRMKRKFFSSTQSTTLDKQGRVLIIPELKEYAGIEHDVKLVGMDMRIEVWNADAWKAYQAADEDDGFHWSETLGALGF